MESRPADQLVIKDYPVALWVVGAALTLGGLLWELAFLALQPGGFWPGGRDLAQPGSVFYMVVTGGYWPGAILFLIGAPIALLASALTVTADRLRGTLTLRYHSLLRTFVKDYPLPKIASVEVDSSRSSTSSSRSSTSYRVALVLASGDKVPWRSYYSGGFSEKDRQARQLREFLGVAGLEAPPATAFQALRQLATPSFTPGQEGATDGVAWRLENANFGGVPVSRWASSDFKLPGSFVCLMQKPPDLKAMQSGGLAGKVSQILYRQVLSMYGINPRALPGFDSALPVEDLDPRLAPSFVSLTNDPSGARQCLNPWVITPLAQWVEQHPMKSIQSAGQAGQVIVLFSPEGTSLTWLNAIAPEQVETMICLGVDLVRAQGAA